MKLIRLFLGVLILLSLACREVEIINGEVPPEYLSEAKKLEGTYTGIFNKIPHQLQIRFVGAVPVLQLIPQSPSCEFTFGPLLSIQGEPKDGGEQILRGASFQVSSSTCQPAPLGDRIILRLEDMGGRWQVEARLLKDYRAIDRCGPGGGSVPPYVGPPHRPCQPDYEPVYLYGRFIKN